MARERTSRQSKWLFLSFLLSGSSFVPFAMKEVALDSMEIARMDIQISYQNGIIS